MRYIQIFSLLLAVMLSQGIYANVASDSSYREKERQARALAQEVLDGREAAVRVYNDFEIYPPGYTKVNVRLQGLSFSYEQIKAVLHDIDNTAVIVILASDQTDPAVAMVLGNYVSSNRYIANGSKNIWPLWSYAREYQYLLFTDALGNPIPNAEVEIQICLETSIGAGLIDFVTAPIGTAVLDSSGRYISPIWSNGGYGLNYVISHPNYGRASIQNHRGKEADNVYIMPLVPLDSEAASRSFRGYVVDNDGNSVDSLFVSFDILSLDNGLKKYESTRIEAVTDGKGQFSIYAPLRLNGKLYTELAPETVKYRIMIHPPRPLNISSYDNLQTSYDYFSCGEEPQKIVLHHINPDQYFHTLVFQDDRGVIDDPNELEEINLTLYRYNEPWQRLTYNEFKDGCYLYEGTLRVQIKRWNEYMNFTSIELTEDSTEELVLKTGYEKIYKGKVVNVKTGLPVPNVLVVTNYTLINNNKLDKLYERIDEFRSQAISESLKGLSREQLYKNDNRVALTDEYGCYQFDFRTGISNELCCFTVLDKNYYSVPVSAMTDSKPKDIEVIDVPVIELLPPEARNPFVIWFGDATGRIITDPNILENIWIKFSDNKGGWDKSKYNFIIEELRQIKYGTYEATLNYKEFNYIYEPVTIDWDSPREIFFKVKKINDREVVLKSKVVNGVTSEPIPGAIVYVNNSLSYKPRSSVAQVERQDIIDSIGDDFDSSNPMVQMLSKTLNAVSIARTGEDGEFQLQVDRQYISDDPMSYLEAIERNFMSARQNFSYSLPIDKDSPEPRRTIVYEPDEHGIIRFSEMRLFPSAQVNLGLNLPDMNSNGQDTEVRYYYRTASDDTTVWLKKFWATPRERMGAGIIRQSHLQPNGRQTISVPAGVEVSLVLYTLHDENTGIVIDGIKLEQGRSLDLGLVEFPPTLNIYVTLIDSQENPVRNVLVNCTDSSNIYFGQRAYSNENGIAVLYVDENSKGEFSVAYRDNETDETLRESIPYEVHGEEDAGKEFILQLSDEILTKLSQ